MSILDDVDEIIERESTEENARKLDMAWSYQQMEKFDKIYWQQGGPKQPVNIDMLGNELHEGDWVFCMRDARGGGQTFELKRIEHFTKRYITCLQPYGGSFKRVQIRPNACIKTTVEQFQKTMEIYESLA